VLHPPVETAVDCGHILFQIAVIQSSHW